METLKDFDLVAIEEEILKWWEDEKIYESIKENEPEDKKFFFMDGPPYTTGDVHIGTAWNKILKDFIMRYKRMQGYRVTDTPGYDTHGLPIEVVIEKQLGIKNKQEILEYGLDNFIEKCRTYAESKIGDMNDQFKRLGCTFWNWDNPYITLKNTYIQGIWWTLKKAWENGYLYKYYRPQNCCPRCATALAKHEFEYYNVQDNAIYVKFQSVEDPKTFYVIWTTTPWTLISNTNIMVNPDLTYAKMQVKDETWIMGIASTADLLQNKLGLTLNQPDGFSYGEKLTGLDLEGKAYIHPFIKEVPIHAELKSQQPKIHTILLSREYVMEGGGTGMVHCAPGHGPEDFEVGMENDIPVFCPVDIHGKYGEDAGEFEGKFVHATNQEIIDFLKEKDTLVYVDPIEHEYAHCWRCKSKLVYRATDQWFFKTTALKEEMLQNNKDIKWNPEFAKRNFNSWLTNLHDWCISRQRFWGVPLSIWTCDNEDECDNMHVIGSMKELEEIAGECPDDIHKPWIDKVTWKCDKCGGTMTRIPDVLDVWLDSGSVLWSSQMFVDGHEHYDSWEPADFILEGKDQIRGWFNSLMCSAMVSSKKRNYNAVYMHGWVMAHGVKMSKSLGNTISPEDLIHGKLEVLTEKQKEELKKLAAKTSTSKFDKAKDSDKGEDGKKKKKRKAAKKLYLRDFKKWSNVKGIETFRFYGALAGKAGKDLNVDPKGYADTFKILTTIWHSYRFTQEKILLNGFEPTKYTLDHSSLSITNKWILSRLNSTLKEETALFEEYKLDDIPEILQDFIQNDLSRWYIASIRDHVSENAEEKEKMATLATLWYVLYRLLLMLAPINPMMTEKIYQSMFIPADPKGMQKSIHLETWPVVDEKYINKDIEAQITSVDSIIEAVRKLKMQENIKLRWPTNAMYIKLEDPSKQKSIEELSTLLIEKCNVKKFEFLSGKDTPKSGKIISTEIRKDTIYLDIEESLEIQQEKIIRDLLRTLQFMRKNAKLQTGEEITLELSTTNAFLQDAVESFKDEIISKVSANPLSVQNKEIDKGDGWENYVFTVCNSEGCHSMLRSAHVEKIEKGEKHTCNYCKKDLSSSDLATLSIRFKKN